MVYSNCQYPEQLWTKNGYILTIPLDLLNPKYVKTLVEERISCSCIERQDWSSSVANSGHCVNYCIFKSSLKFEKYLTLLNWKEAIDFCRFKCSNHKLPVVTCRFINTERSEHVCTLCNLNMIGDEYHCIYVCPAFNHEQSVYIPRNQLKFHNTMTMHFLFHQTSVSNLAKFCRAIMDRFK